MSDSEGPVPIGPVLDQLGITIDLAPQDRLVEVMVLAKVMNLDDGMPSLYTVSNDLDWIQMHGLLAAAKQVMHVIDPEGRE